MSEESKKLTLRAGPLALVYTPEGELRSLMLGDREVLRRVYAAVRDCDWGTVPAVLTDIKIEVQAESFRISYQADHRRDGIHFAWQGRITGDADGRVTFAINGTALTSFWRNRIGLCVLHPPAECAGRPCVVTHTSGTVEAGLFPEAIAPHQPFRQVRALAHEIRPGLWADVTFEGDVFEMEDQRNWTDASFKTYSTPLDIPFPVWTPAGTAVQQSVTLRLRGPCPQFAPRLDRGPVQIIIPDLPALPLPCLGLGMASHGQPLTSRAARRLRALNLDHLRVDVMLSDPAYPARLEQAASEAQALGVRLLTALHLSEEAESELAALRAVIAGSDWPLGGWLVFSLSTKCTPASSLTQARAFLEKAVPNALFLGGTAAYFAELNRGHPALAGADGAVYSVSPQVHAFDDDSLMETPEAQAATVHSARRLYPSHALWVSPVTLKPRFNPDAARPGEIKKKEARREAVDVRQKSSLTAAWTISSFKHLAEAGAAGVTYFETTGERGVMEADGSAVFPVYQALADIGSYAGGKILPSVSSHPRRIECLLVRCGQKTGAILANLTPQPQDVLLQGLLGRQEQTLPPYAVLKMDILRPGPGRISEV